MIKENSETEYAHIPLGFKKFSIYTPKDLHFTPIL